MVSVILAVAEVVANVTEVNFVVPVAAVGVSTAVVVGDHDRVAVTVIVVVPSSLWS